MEFPTISFDDIEKLKKKVKLELCRPDKKTIAILKEAYGIRVSIKAMQINVLEFNLPLKIDYHGKLIDNPHIADMRPYYLIRLSVGNHYQEYFRITKPRSEGGEENYKYYYCLSYINNLSDKKLDSYSVVSYTIDEVLNGKPSENMPGILEGTNWKTSYISPIFTTRYRSVESGSTTKLNFILDTLVNSYNCLPVFDTRNNEINIYSPEEIGKDLGLTLSYRKYIKSLGLEIDPTSEFTTRLYCQGKDGLTIHDVTPTGQNYLENYSYFMYPFSRYPTTSRYESTQEDFAEGTLVDVEATANNTLKLASGKTEGYRIWPELDLSDTGIAEDSVVRYKTKNEADAKWINIKSSIDNGSTWQLVENNSPIPGINKGDDLTGKKVLIKSEFYTDNPDDSPELEELYVAVHGATIQSSDGYFSNELCHAQLNYKEKLELYEGKFEDYLTEKESLWTTRAGLETEVFNLLTQLHMVEDRIAVLHGIDNAYYRYDVAYDGAPVIHISELDSEYKYVVIAKASSTDNFLIKLDNTTIPIEQDTWEVLGKISGQTSSRIDLSGSATDVDTIIIYAKITDEEYETSDNEEELIENYCEPKKADEYEAKVAEIDGINEQIALIDAEIAQLRIDLSLENNFSPELIEERNNYIIEKTYSNQHIIDSHTLLEEANKYFENINSPPLILELDTVNFLDCIEGYPDYDRLFYSALEAGLYDKLRVCYEPHGIDVKCMITEIDLDIENSSLKFVVSNVREVLTEDKKMLKDLDTAVSGATTLLQEKFKWDGASQKTNEIEEILLGVWDAARRAIESGVNNSVTIDRRGITITDPNNPLHVIRMVAGWIGISADGGNTFRTAINGSGVYASELVGQIIAGEFLKIVNESGTFEVNKDGVIIGANALQVSGGIPDDQIQNAESWNNKVDQSAHDELSNMVNENNANLQEIRTYFAFRPDGLNIGKTDSPLQINISNEQIDFMDTGQVVAYINGQKMYIGSLEVLTSLLLGRHLIEKYDDNTTLIRWVG